MRKINFIIILLGAILISSCVNNKLISNRKKIDKISNFDYSLYIGKPIGELLIDLNEEFEKATFYSYKGYIFGGVYFIYNKNPDLFIKIDVKEFAKDFPYSVLEQEKWTIELVSFQKIQKVRVFYKNNCIKSFD